MLCPFTLKGHNSISLWFYFKCWKKKKKSNWNVPFGRDGRVKIWFNLILNGQISIQLKCFGRDGKLVVSPPTRFIFLFRILIPGRRRSWCQIKAKTRKEMSSKASSSSVGNSARSLIGRKCVSDNSILFNSFWFFLQNFYLAAARRKLWSL